MGSRTKNREAAGGPGPQAPGVLTALPTPPRPEPASRSEPASLRSPPCHPLYFLQERHLSSDKGCCDSEVQRSQEAVGDPGTHSKWGGVGISGVDPS